MKKNTRKMATTLAACALVGAMAVGGTMAYLTDAETVTNTFTVGNVETDLTEPNKPDEETPRVPNEEMAKDPTVQNTGDNDQIVFIAFDIPMANVITAGYDGTLENGGVAHDVELFDFRKETGSYDSVNDGWVQLYQTTAADKSKVTYIYGYKDVLGVDEAAPAIFDHVRMANVIEGELPTDEQLHMPVRAYAIQADFLQDADNADGNHDIVVGKDMDDVNLKKVYSIFANQNPDAVKADGFVVDEADTNGNLDLNGDEIPQA